MSNENYKVGDPKEFAILITDKKYFDSIGDKIKSLIKNEEDFWWYCHKNFILAAFHSPVICDYETLKNFFTTFPETKNERLCVYQVSGYSTTILCAGVALCRLCTDGKYREFSIKQFDELQNHVSTNARNS